MSHRFQHIHILHRYQQDRHQDLLIKEYNHVDNNVLIKLYNQLNIGYNLKDHLILNN